MKSEKEIKAFLKQLKEEGYNRFSINMQYEWSGAVGVLEWILDIRHGKPVIGQR